MAMQDAEASRPLDHWVSGRLLAMLMVITAGNGFFAAAMATWHDTRGDYEAVLGTFSPVEMLTLIAGSVRLWNVKYSERVLWLCLPFALLVLLPSSLVAWVALAGLGLIVSLVSQGRARQGGILFLALAILEVWQAVGDPLYGQIFREFDALVVGRFLSAFLPDVTVVENVVYVSPRASIIVLTGCSTLAGLPRVVLGWATLIALSEANDRTCPGRYWRLGLGLTVAYFLMNWLRLSLMAPTLGLHEIVHGDFGSNLFDVLTLLLMVAFAFGVLRRS